MTSDNEEETNIYELDIDLLIEKLQNGINNPGQRVNLDIYECQAICCIIRSIFEEETMLLNVQAPIKICGDTHGQFYDLLRLFKLGGVPPDTRYLFLGDYVDRGKTSLEVICLLFAYKLKYPQDIYLLRGNHESEVISRVYGFRQEIKERFDSTHLWKSFVRTFSFMPVAALVEDSIFCCHGGISPALMEPNCVTLASAINDVPRPTEVPTEGLLCDLLWADPMPAKTEDIPNGWAKNQRGCSWTFGYDIVEDFTAKFELDLIVRAHQVVVDGYEFYANRKLVTIFSAPNYVGEYDNAGGIFCLGKPTGKEASVEVLEGAFQLLKPDNSVKDQWYKNLRKKGKKKLPVESPA